MLLISTILFYFFLFCWAAVSIPIISYIPLLWHTIIHVIMMWWLGNKQISCIYWCFYYDWAVWAGMLCGFLGLIVFVISLSYISLDSCSKSLCAMLNLWFLHNHWREPFYDLYYAFDRKYVFDKKKRNMMLLFIVWHNNCK